MIDESVLRSGLAYLDECRTLQAEPTLRGLVGHIDTHSRIVVTVEEINEVLRRSPSLRLQRVNGRVHFAPEGLDGRINCEDLERAFIDCDAEFEAKRRRRRALVK
ncbi:MAG TPA: hypothetical protein VMD92_13340 [Acidobacteriaceae bacterium]|jgi:hypothetical protein|nr:hypothetical protein [Acidobacteriaceae bacterium]